MIEMNIKTNLFTWLSPEKEMEMIRNGLIEEARDEGEKIGIAKKEKQLVKKMLLDGLDPNFIKKYVKMSLTEINKIKTTII